MNIIPAIDILGGNCVRLVEGDYSSKKVYDESPVDVAVRFREAGFTRLHVVDLDGAKSGSLANFRIIEEIVARTGVEIQAGGGVRTENSLERLLGAGVASVLVGSLAVTDRAQFADWVEKFGPNKFTVCVDVRNNEVMIKGWIESGKINLNNLIIELRELGIGDILCTDISKDGMLAGPAIELYERLTQEFPEIRFIASGGVSSIKDLERLSQTRVFGVVVGKAIYEGRVSLKELKGFYAD